MTYMSIMALPKSYPVISARRSLRVVLLLCTALLGGFSVSAFADLVKAIQQDNYLVLHLSDSTVRISALSDNAFEVFYQPQGIQQLPSFALPDKAERKAHVSNIEYNNSDSKIVFSVNGLSAHITKAPFSIAYYRNNTLLVAEEVGLFSSQTMRGFRFRLQDHEKLMGGGQRVMGMNRRGQRMPLYNKAHYGYSTESSQMYYSLPAVMSSNMYTLAFDNTASGHLDIGATQHDILQFEAVAGRTSYIISAGDTYRQLSENLTQVMGTQPLPPRWALGNFASRFGYKTQKQSLDTAQMFIDQDIPLDALVLDLFWFGPDIQGHMGNLDWDRNTFPSPKKMIDQLDDAGISTILITEPFILSSSSKWQSAVDNKALATNFAGEARKFDFYFGNTGLVDVFSDAGQQWFWSHYARLNEYGVAGWWGDLGEPEVHPSDSLHYLGDKRVTADEIHNAYGHQWARVVYQNQLQARPNERPFIMMRSGFLGSQRYGMIPWTGDVERSWNGLKPQVELALQMSMFGLAYTHSDLGGFAGGETFDPELYIRWMQYGVFQPVYRPHAQDNIAPEPVFHDEPSKDIVRQYIKLRYAMLPYNYSLSMHNSLLGTPMMRPVFFDSASSNIDDIASYFWGDAFLVTPITSPGVEQVSIDLPSGYWFDFWTDKLYQGGKTIEWQASLENLPVMVKAGEFVPMASKAMQHTKAYDPSYLDVHYYAHQSVNQSSYTMLDDDGVDPQSLADKAYQRIEFSAQFSDPKILSINAGSKGSFEGVPSKRTLRFVIHGIEHEPSRIELNGKVQESFSYDKQSKRLTTQVVLNSDSADTQALRLHW